MAPYGLVGDVTAGALRMLPLVGRLGSSSYSMHLVHITVVLFHQQLLLRLEHFVSLRPKLAFIADLDLCIVTVIAFSERVEQ